LARLGASAILGAIGKAMKWRYELKKLHAEDQKRKREDAVCEMLQQIQAAERELRKRAPNAYLSKPRASKGENPDILVEAWERYVKERFKNTGPF